MKADTKNSQLVNLVYAISSSGKSTLAERDPNVIDGDSFLYATLQKFFPEQNERSRLLHWKKLCRLETTDEEIVSLRGKIRADYTGRFVHALGSGKSCIITSIIDLPFDYNKYFGYEKGNYLQHLSESGRVIDNLQSEEYNDNLDKFKPLIRLPRGHYLTSEDVLSVAPDNIPFTS